MYPFRVSGAVFLALALFFAACDGGSDDNDNRVPVAHITALSEGIVHHEIRVDGSGSAAHTGTRLTYTWTLQTPDFSAAQLIGADEPIAYFVPDVAGAYRLSLVVASGRQRSKATEWTITIHEDPNQAPVAHAGSPATVHVGRAIRLDGTQSHDPDGKVKAFRWTLVDAPGASVAELDDDRSARPTFVPDRVGDYKFQLVVNDGLRDSAPAEVQLTATNSAPVVTVGQLAPGLSIGDTVSLVISAMDPDDDPITFAWTLDSPDGSRAVLDDETAARPRFTLDVPGEYVATVVVSDGWNAAAPVRVAVVVHNRAPSVWAGSGPLVGWIGQPVHLTGTANDPDGQPLSYRWTLVGPAGNPASINDDRTLQPYFVPNAPGTWTATLVASDGIVESQPSSIQVVVENRKPSVRIGMIPVLPVGSTVTIRGYGTDPDRQILTWSWSLLAGPQGSTAALTGTDTDSPSIVVDRVGVYQVEAKVHDGHEWSEPAITRFEVQNRRPVVDAGSPQTVDLGAVVSLQGTAVDEDNQTLTTTWSFVSRPTGSTATFSSPNTLSTTFTPDKPGNYVIALKANDGVEEGTGQVTITVLNKLPVANAGPNGVGHIGEAYTLTGSGTDEDPGHQAILTYAWSLTTRPTGSTASVTNANRAQASFTPDKEGTYVATLRVSDGFGHHDATVTITVANRAPTVDAGTDKIAHVGDTVTTAPVFTDPDKQTPTWAWVLTTRPEGSAATLTNANQAGASFKPDVPGVYLLTVTANDGYADATDTLTVTVYARPVAVAGTAQKVLVGDVVNLDGSQSSDPNGSELTYQWSFTTRPSGSTATLTNATTAQPRFTADKAGAYKVKLVVTNVRGGTGTAEVDISANQPPVAKAGGAKTARVDDIVILDGSQSSDADGSIASYAWALVDANPAVTLTDTTLSKAKLVATAPGTYTVRLTVTDNLGAAHSDTAVITINANKPPVANAGGNKTAFVHQTVALVGTATDPEGDAIKAKAWSFVGNVTADQATLTVDPADSSKATFKALVDGVFTLQFSATDARDAVGSATMTITTTWQTPEVMANATPSTVKVGNAATFAGRAADGYVGQLVTFDWSIVSAPQGSTAAFVNGNQATATFTPDKAGNYVLMFTAADAIGQEAFAAVVLTATATAPVARITAPAQIDAGQVVTVSASTSTPGDGTLASRKWSFVSKPASSAAAFADDGAETTTFTADTHGNYVVRLVVTNSAGLSHTTQHTVVGIAAPIANAGSDKFGFIGRAVELDGSGSSDPMGGTLTWDWALAPGQTGAVLSAANSPTPTLLASEEGIYDVILTVTNSVGRTDSDTVQVVISEENAAPVPVIDDAQGFEVVAGGSLQLTATATDADGDAIDTWEWAIESGPEGHEGTLLAGSDEATMTFTADLVGEYVVTLTVTDARGKAGTTEVTVNVTFPAITITGTDDVWVDEGALLQVSLAGGAEVVSTAWRVLGVDAAVADIGPVVDQPAQGSFVATAAGAYTVEVDVTDIHGNVETSQVVITVQEAPGIP